MDEAAGQTWTALSTALDPDRMHSVLTGALGRREVRGDDAFVAMPPADARLGARVLKHKHGRRCVIRYALSGREDGEAGDAVGKVYRDEARAERMYRRVQGLRRRLPDPEARCIPAPLGYLRELGLVLQEWRPGRDLRHALAEPTAQQACARSAHWLAALHAAAPLEGLKHRTLDYELTRIEKFRSAIRARAGAEVPAGLAAACHGLQAAAARLGPYAPRFRSWTSTRSPSETRPSTWVTSGRIWPGTRGDVRAMRRPPSGWPRLSWQRIRARVMPASKSACFSTRPTPS
jgi:hypothetical protein